MRIGDIKASSPLLMLNFFFRCFVFFRTGDQHEYCKSDNSDAIQATENTSARENTFQAQQDSSDNSRVANRTKSNRPTGYRDRPSTSINNQQVSKQQKISTGNLSPGEAKQQASSPSPDTTISLGSSTSTAIRAEPNSFGHNNNNNNSKSNYHGHITVDNNSTSKRSPVTGEKPITGAFSAVTAPLTSAKLESNNNNRNISDM